VPPLFFRILVPSPGVMMWGSEAYILVVDYKKIHLLDDSRGFFRELVLKEYLIDVGKELFLLKEEVFLWCLALYCHHTHGASLSKKVIS